ncbi:uncharacterized protein LOC115739912 isoform X2 [Rhodamnia argentea]|uniref:Uncharacterized protein LOC115739912 isoform X2 n=1 Tax=Rhodamnia argentea TaxID=178133 RepID=A0ABM3HFR2_9MYRT|nr:uncharacterized protein LOC115739912 isoform X2 [Rhodamnia argentea]
MEPTQSREKREMEEEEEEEEDNDEEAKAKKTTTMTPWEQHSAVISIPRFDYNAPSSLLRRSHSGFLITCTIKREKSATKEAMSLLEKCYGTFAARESNNLEVADAKLTPKRRKVCPEELDKEGANGAECGHSTDQNGNEGKLSEDVSSQTEEDSSANESQALSLVKLTGSGLLLFTFPHEDSADTVQIVSDIIDSLGSTDSSSPHWCHRIFPIQATCSLNEPDLRTVVQKLVLKFLKDRPSRLALPIKFAVGYNRRGLEETERKNSKDKSDGSDLLPLLDRHKCFEVVAAAVKDAISDSVVDLKNPEISVLVELLPLSAVPSRSLVAAVSVLPQKLVTTKPRLCVKALVPQAKSKNK